MDKETLEKHYQKLKKIEDDYNQGESEISRFTSERDKIFAERGLDFKRKTCVIYIRENPDLYKLLTSIVDDAFDKTITMDEFDSPQFFSSCLALLLEELWELIDKKE